MEGVENLHTRKPSTSFLRFGLALPCYAITRSLENEFAVVSWSCFYPKKRVCQSLAKKSRRTDFSEKQRTCRHRGCTCDSTDPRVPNLPYIHNSPRNPNSTGFGTTPETVSEVRAIPSDGRDVVSFETLSLAGRAPHSDGFWTHVRTCHFKAHKSEPVPNTNPVVPSARIRSQVAFRRDAKPGSHLFRDSR